MFFFCEGWLDLFSAQLCDPDDALALQSHEVHQDDTMPRTMHPLHMIRLFYTRSSMFSMFVTSKWCTNGLSSAIYRLRVYGKRSSIYDIRAVYEHALLRKLKLKP